MLDTLILEIPINFLQITNPDRFKPRANILQTLNGYIACKQNPTADDRKRGIYKPKLTIMKRGGMTILKTEFSAPKMIFGNNLEELEDKNYLELVLKIQRIIREMGVSLNVQQIEKAKVIGFHPSKNIVLTSGYTSSFAIRELSKINLTQKMDIERIGFRNGGESMQIYANCHSVVFYDKINDLSKPAKRAIDKDQTKQQQSLLEFINRKNNKLEVLRFEIRLSRSRKMKEVLAEVGFIEEPLLKNVFKKELCQKIVILYWEKLFGKNLFLFNTYNNPQKILEMILVKYPETRIRTAVMLVGLNLLCKDDDGFRSFRKIVENYKEKTDWCSLRRYLEKLSDGFFTRPMHGFVNDIQREIKKFNSFKLNKKD